MSHHHPSATFRILLFVFLACGSVGPTPPTAWLRAEIIGYQTVSQQHSTALRCIVLRQSGKQIAYDAQHLIPSRVTYFRSPHTLNVLTTVDQSVPDSETRADLLGDLLLNTGIINPGGQSQPLKAAPVIAGTGSTPGMAIAFDQPVVNRTGDDLVLFEIQRSDTAHSGDIFHIGPLELTPSLRAITIRSFDVGYGHPSAAAILPHKPCSFKQPVLSNDDFRNLPLQSANASGGFQALAVGVDLSRLGYAPGAEVNGLFLQSTGGGAMIDPVLVAGLPAPVTPNILAEVPKIAQPPRLLDDFLDDELADVQQIVFAERIPGNDHWYANFGHYWCGNDEYPQQRLPDDWQPTPIFKQGGRLSLWNIRTRELTVLVDDPAGGVRDPQVHYDAQRILFSYRPGGQPYYHLYEINVDGSNLRQVTDGPHDDIEPTYLPDGDILFCSSRAERYVNCWRTPVAVLYRCNSVGEAVRMVSTNIEHDNTPWVLPDGRVLYMRWEYVDRSQVDFHHLWTVNPDGSGQMVYFGNQYAGTAMLDAKPIAGTKKVVASFSPGHGRPEHMGSVTVVDPGYGPDSQGAAYQISQPGKSYRDPYALSEDCFLAANAQGVLLMDGQGNTQVLCRGDDSRQLQCHEPRPVHSRPRERIVAPQSDPSQDTGQLFLADIYHGRHMDSVDKGEIKKLLVLEQLPKPVNFSGGPWPLSIGATFSLSRILGTVPVEPDGSASFEVPAMRSVFFVALDENDLAVKRMQSFVTLQPGERLSCVGCHEQRTNSPHALQDRLASHRAPRRIQSIADVPTVLDFPRDIQPILDTHCTKCHNSTLDEGHVDLTGNHTPLFCQSYWTIIQRGLISDGRNQKFGNRSPRSIGSAASPLLSYLDGSHHEAKLTEQEQQTVRLWIDTSAAYAGTYAALGSGMHPVRFPIEVFERRCVDCHGQQPPAKGQVGNGSYFTFGGPGPALPLVHEFADLKQLRSAVGYFEFGRSRTPQSLCNLSHPARSVLLRAPLACSAGGLGRCGQAIFTDTKDADYQDILAAISDASQRHQHEKRFDMPDFRPNDHYLLKMKQYGILPSDLSSTTPVDAYSTDEAYWQSFWYEPRRMAAR